MQSHRNSSLEIWIQVQPGYIGSQRGQPRPMLDAMNSMTGRQRVTDAGQLSISQSLPAQSVTESANHRTNYNSTGY